MAIDKAAARITVLLVLVVACTLPARALVVRGDIHWRGTDDCTADFAEPLKDDSTWSPVSFPWVYVWPPTAVGVDDARPFWTTTEKPTSCVRRHFTLRELPTGSAVANIWVDDDYEFYLNGTFVGASHDHWAKAPGESYDVSSLLQRGDNVVALRLIDLGGEARAAMFSLSIPGAPDEPITFADVAYRAVPWITFVVVVAAAALVFVAIRTLAAWSGPLVRRLPAGALAVAMLALMITSQWALQTGRFYSTDAHRGFPWAEWDWLHLALSVVPLVLLGILGTRSAAPVGETATPRREWLIVVGILLLATFLRTVALDTVPVGFFQDEAINGNDALTLFDGRPLRIWSESIGGRPTLFLYVLGACLRLFGRSYLSLKIAPVFFGVASVLALYLLGRVAFGPRPALWAAFLLAISWYDIHYSRMAWEASCVPLFSAAGFALLLYGLGSARHPLWALAAAGVVLAMGLYTYAAYRAVPAGAVVFVMATALSSDRAVLRKRALGLIMAGLAAAVVLAPLINFAWHNPQAYWRRYEDVSLTVYMRYYGTPLPWLHQIGKALLAFNQYGGPFNPSPYLDPFTGAVFLLGAFSRASAGQERGRRLVWAWFLTFVALSSLTRDSPHLTRNFGALPPTMLFAGVGITRLVAQFRAALSERPPGAVVRRLALRFAIPACAAAALVYATAFNAYEYFIARQNLPDVDMHMNLRARQLCETVRHAMPIRFYYTYDLEYWCAPQCVFLAPGAYPMPFVLHAEHLLDTAALRNAPGPVLVAVGNEFLDANHTQFPRDENGEPRLDFPVRPVVQLDRKGWPIYYLYWLPGKSEHAHLTEAK